TEKNIENAVVCFKIEKAWMKDKGIDQSSIILNRYNDKKWNPLPTSQSGDDEKYMYFTAETLGFSSFAITGEITAKETVTEILPIPDTQNLEQNNTASEVEETSEPKEKTSMPGFEMIYCVIGLLGVFLYRRR
ncbi:PGF-pre-PGF domain-containing protein, partial [Methanosarcina sp. 1.H.T.1A.1]|uniref:PGF-pre-PGF domain-containing protein n=1 Tax=Methanosarcina sp. 1.H.T.1A.1 TaxID=1483602 RepID=UPI00064E549E